MFDALAEMMGGMMNNESIDEGMIGGQNLLQETHNGYIYSDNGGEVFEKDGSISGQVYKFNKEFTLRDVITLHGYYTLSFLLYCPPVEGNLFNVNTMKIRFFSELDADGQTVDVEMSTSYNNENSDFKFVKFTIDTSITDLTMPVHISIYSVYSLPFVISDLKLERGKIATSWCKSIDDAIINIPENLLNKPKLGSLVIPATGWLDYKDDPTGYYTKYIDVPVKDVTTQHVLNGNVRFKDNDIAANCDMALKIETFSGFARFFAHTVPEAEINVDYILILGKHKIDDNGVMIIPAEGWIDSGLEYYEKKLVLNYEGITEKDYLIGSASFATNDIVAECELSSVETGDGTVTFLARKVPTGPIEYEYTILETEEESNE